MGEALVSILLQALPMLLLAGLLAASGRAGFNPRWFAVAIALVLLNDLLLTRFYDLFSGIGGSNWNWIGKLLALAATLAIAALPSFGFRRSGITLRQLPGSWAAWAVTGALGIFFLGLALATGDGRPEDADTIAFQWTMPGFEEETFYRGILLLALNESFAARRRILGAEMGWGALLGSLLFGAVHGLSYGDGGIGFEPIPVAITFVSALLLVWLRERTGSIAAPIVAHNVGNGVFTLL